VGANGFKLCGCRRELEIVILTHVSLAFLFGLMCGEKHKLPLVPGHPRYLIHHPRSPASSSSRSSVTGAPIITATAETQHCPYLLTRSYKLSRSYAYNNRQNYQRYNRTRCTTTCSSRRSST